MGFAEIIGQQRIARLLRQALAQGNLPHAFLFTGMEGIGKRLMAITLAKAVNCDNNDDVIAAITVSHAGKQWVATILTSAPLNEMGLSSK